MDYGLVLSGIGLVLALFGAGYWAGKLESGFIMTTVYMIELGTAPAILSWK